MANIGDILYRYEDVAIRTSDDFGFTAGPPKVQIVLRKYPITRLTPKGVVVTHKGKDKRIISKAPKRFAHPTPIQALEGFIARKQSQLLTLQNQHARAKTALAIGQQQLNKVMFGE